MTHTYRVVVTHSDETGFYGASGTYPTIERAKAELLDIGRSWVGLAPVLLQADGSITVDYSGRTDTYSILTERKSEQ